ncbi:hypothetical protein [Anaerosolibacter sp.]|uniref:hypothetical protein n=1 Tax=Anaerosolibacter sp. TaxID=1872527 RepID=UPI0039EFCE72
MEIEIDIRNLEVIADLYDLLNDIYNHEDTPQTVKDMMDLKVRRIMGKQFDTHDALKHPRKK